MRNVVYLELIICRRPILFEHNCTSTRRSKGPGQCKNTRLITLGMFTQNQALAPTRKNSFKKKRGSPG